MNLIKNWLARILSGFAVILAAAAIFARQIGIDNNTEWGRGRYVLLAAGLCFMILSIMAQNTIVILRLEKQLHDRLYKCWNDFCRSQIMTRPAALWSSVTNSRLALSLQRVYRGFAITKAGRYLTGSPGRMTLICALLLAVPVLMIQFDVVTGGKHALTYYYQELIEAFSHFQLHLVELPDPLLTALENPYDHPTRDGAHVFWDASLYNGKYYLYWGPVPALIGLLLRPFFSQGVSDLYLVFLFSAGTFLFSLLLLVTVWRKLFSDIPAWLVFPGILAAGLSNPLIWILSRPSVYEASIIGGQFFLLPGLYFAFRALSSQQPQRKLLAATGICWALAVGSRVTLALTVILLFILLIWQIYRQAGQRRISRQVWLAWLSLTIPLALGAAALSAYNYARFDSIFEFGHRYQLTGVNLSEMYQEGWVASTDYVIPNLYNYLLRPIEIFSDYPYVAAPWLKEESWPFFIRLPQHYFYSEPVSGVLAALPYTWLIVIPLILALIWLAQGRTKLLVNNDIISNAEKQEQWLIYSLFGAAVLEISPVLSFYFSAMRYTADLVPTLVILSSLGFWQGYRLLKKRPLWRGLWVIFGCCLALASAMIGVLIEVNR